MLSIVYAKDWNFFKVFKEKLYENLGEILGILLINFNLLGKTYFNIKKILLIKYFYLEVENKIILR